MKKYFGKISILIDIILLLSFMWIWFPRPFIGFIGLITITILFSIHLKKYTNHNVIIPLFILFLFFFISPILQIFYVSRTYCDFVKTEVLKADNGHVFDFSKGKVNYIEGGGFQDGYCRATISFNPQMRRKILQMGNYWHIEDDCIDYLFEHHHRPSMENFLRKDSTARMPNRCAIHEYIDDKSGRDDLIIYDLDRNKLFYEYHNN